MADAQTNVDHAYDQVVEWLEHFEELDDPRKSGKVAYPLDEMLLQCLLAVLAGADSRVEIAEFGRKKLDRGLCRSLNPSRWPAAPPTPHGTERSQPIRLLP